MAARKPIRQKRKIVAPKKCVFCDEQKTPTYSDSNNLQKFMTERGKIIGRVRSGLCAKHQRKLTEAIKYARHLALLPFVGLE
ncbi:30S ribosomal protein S18 [soil metagenome]